MTHESSVISENATRTLVANTGKKSITLVLPEQESFHQHAPEVALVVVVVE